MVIVMMVRSQGPTEICLSDPLLWSLAVERIFRRTGPYNSILLHQALRSRQLAVYKTYSIHHVAFQSRSQWPRGLRYVFDRSNTEIIGSNPTRGTDDFISLFCV
jgi:hypothetical protein